MRALRAGLIGLTLALSVAPATLNALDLPAGTHDLSQRVSELDNYDLPIGPFDGEKVPSLRLEGRVDRRTWRIDGGSATTLQLLAPIRAQLEDAGYEILLECRDQECGGFDFRFGTEIVPAPDMQVDIRNYRFLSAVKRDSGLTVLISRGRSAAYLQVIRVEPADLPQDSDVAPTADIDAIPAEPVQTAPAVAQGLEAQLMQVGHVALDDLVFDSGAARLSNGAFASLEALATFLEKHPAARIALVGHTDSVGDLQSNIALSRRRAESIRTRLIEIYGADASRVAAEGMGYLAPRASNLTAQGRDANRRVEAVLLSNG